MKILHWLLIMCTGMGWAQQTQWVDSLYQKLTIPEKVGQLFMVAAYSNKDSVHIKEVINLVEKSGVGGVIFFQGGPVRQAKLTNTYQSKAKVPLLVGIDAEWGLSMRLDSTYRYPYNMTLGALTDFKLVEQYGKQMGKQAKRLGIHFTFAPVVDINTNPNNPIIGVRSFGETKEIVTQQALAYMKGLQSEGVWATAKHFPGHGDTATDSHKALPYVSFDKNRFNEIELYPYKQLINNGLASIMVAHLEVPNLEPLPNTPSSISKTVITDLLKTEMGFKGLIFTDALNMKGATRSRKPGELELEAFKAGNDVLLFSENVPLAIQLITDAVTTDSLLQKRLEESVKKILAFKYQSNLDKPKPINTTSLYNDIHLHENEALTYNIFKNAITVLKNRHHLIPIHKLEKEKIAYIPLGDDNYTHFKSTLESYTHITEIKPIELDSVQSQLQGFTKIIIGYHKVDNPWKSHKFSSAEITLLHNIARQHKTILVSFAKPYILSESPDLDDFEGLILAYQNHPYAQQIAAQLIFGTVEAQGKVPVTITECLPVNEGHKTHSLQRLGFDIPENVGLSSEKLTRIDSLANYAIQQKITPGLQVLVARKGKVVYQKSFGNHTYTDNTPVKNTDKYDLASLTKILATLPLVMQLYDKGEVCLETTLKQMLPEFKETDKKDILFTDLLTHQARLQPWIPFYQATLNADKKPSEKYYRTVPSDSFAIPVAQNLYLRTDYKDTLWNNIVKSPLLAKKQYKYSDFTFIILKKWIEKEFKKPLDTLAYQHFYRKIGAQLMFNPYQKNDSLTLIPSEIDTYFRYQPIKGYVHDMAAAMMGGVSGHAGLFGNALEVAKIMQMYLNKGQYADNRFFDASTFDVFNSCYFCNTGNRRGLGFDKPQLGAEGPTCGCTSKNSFGHTGFTGTMAWADPDKELIYIFLSNRTYPDGSLNRLSKESIREKIQQYIYEAIID